MTFLPDKVFNTWSGLNLSLSNKNYRISLVEVSSQSELEHALERQSEHKLIPFFSMIATGIPKGKNSNGTTTGTVKIFYTDADWSRYFKTHVTIEGLIFMEHFGHGILVHDFNNDGLEG